MSEEFGMLEEQVEKENNNAERLANDAARGIVENNLDFLADIKKGDSFDFREYENLSDPEKIEMLTKALVDNNSEKELGNIHDCVNGALVLNQEPGKGRDVTLANLIARKRHEGYARTFGVELKGSVEEITLKIAKVLEENPIDPEERELMTLDLLSMKS